MCDKQNKNSVPVHELFHDDRVQDIVNKFSNRFNAEPDFFVRVPGRVNLIGEHIDYSGYGVCPMALDQDIFLAVSEGSNPILHLSNVNTGYEDFQCDLHDFSIAVSSGAPKWHQYFLCGVKGLCDILPGDTKLKGMNVLVSGTIPQSAGLSSSSALVSAAALAASHLYNIAIDKEEIANLCAECERYIGTQGGGMDQAIAFLASEGCAKKIEFSPLRSSDVKLPPGAVFVIAHSLAELNKAATSDFNCRVIECRLAAQVMAKRLGLEWRKMRKLSDLQTALDRDLEGMLSVVEKTLHPEPYTKEEILRELDTTSDNLDDTSLTPNTKHLRSFLLRQRALHVFQEARRVELFVAACRSPHDETTLQTLGQLMSASHQSLRDLYECSHPQLDELVELSRDLTLGARLTGAGWGGCVVALVPEHNVDKYMKMLTEKFYSSRPVSAELSSVLFATAPRAGACIYKTNRHNN